MIEAKARWQLPQDRPEFFFQAQHAGREEIGKRRFNTFQPLKMRDETAAFHREYEIARRRIMPCLIALWSLEGIEGAIDFNRVHLSRGEFQFEPMGQSFRKKNAAPRRVSPPRNSDADGFHNINNIVYPDASQLEYISPAHLRHRRGGILEAFQSSRDFRFIRRGNTIREATIVIPVVMISCRQKSCEGI